MECDDIYTRQSRNISNSFGKTSVIGSGGFNEIVVYTPAFSKGMFFSRGTRTSEKLTYRLINLLELKTKEEKLDVEVIRGTPRFVVVQDSPFWINWGT